MPPKKVNPQKSVPGLSPPKEPIIEVVDPVQPVQPVQHIPHIEPISVILTEVQPPAPTQPQPQREPQPMSCLQHANQLVNFINLLVSEEILSGNQRMFRKKPLPSLTLDVSPPKPKHLQAHQKPVDIDQHRKMIRKFMRMNRKSMKKREKQFQQFQQNTRRHNDDESKRKQQFRNRTLELRRQRISQKMRQKQLFMQELRQNVFETNQKLQIVKQKKWLYQQKQQQFEKYYTLPKLQHEKKIILQKKQMRKPIDLDGLRQHQRLYQQKRMQDKVNRTISSRVLQSQNHYQPPKFIPKSYMILEAEHQVEEQEKQIKKQQTQMNHYRQKQFLRVMQERQRHQYDKSLDKSRSRSKSPKNKIFGSKSTLDKEKVVLSKQQTTKLGNNYLRNLAQFNKNRKKKGPVTQNSSERSFQTKVRAKSQFQIQLVKEQRIQKIQKIRLKNIDQIVQSSKMNVVSKKQRLEFQSQKMDRLLKYQSKKQSTQQLANLVLSSIHTKLALLTISSPKREKKEQQFD